MRIDVRVPYRVRVRAGAKSFRQGWVTASLPVDVPEFSGADCPLAAVVTHRDGRVIEYRSVGARLATVPRRPPEFADDAEWLRATAKEPWKSSSLGLTGTIVSCKPPREEDVESRPLPDGQDGHGRDYRLAESSGLAAELALVDGAVWVRGPDSVLSLARKAGDRRGSVVPFPAEGCATTLDTFRLDQADLAERYLARCYPNSESDLPHVEMVDPTLFTDGDPQVAALRTIAGWLLKEEGNSDRLVYERLRHSFHATHFDAEGLCLSMRDFVQNPNTRSHNLRREVANAAYAYSLAKESQKETDLAEEDDVATLGTWSP